eukprot:scaffold6829_cov171-Amphora_coffeaeformis.AAC.25
MAADKTKTGKADVNWDMTASRRLIVEVVAGLAPAPSSVESKSSLADSCSSGKVLCLFGTASGWLPKDDMNKPPCGNKMSRDETERMATPEKAVAGDSVKQMTTVIRVRAVNFIFIYDGDEGLDVTLQYVSLYGTIPVVVLLRSVRVLWCGLFFICARTVMLMSDLSCALPSLDREG